MADVKRTEHEPHDRLTRLTDVMTKALMADPEHRDGDRAIILLDNDGRGGLILHGYDEGSQEPVIRMLSHVNALLESLDLPARAVIVGAGH